MTRTPPDEGSARSGPSAQISPLALAVIRIAILAGILLFGAVIWFLHRQPGWSPMRPEALRTLRGAALLVCGAMLAVTMALRVAHGRATTVVGGARLAILGWALAEIPALLGGVYYYLSNDPRLYVLGIVILLAAFIILPLRRSD
jgi:hypothetical protein